MPAEWRILFIKSLILAFEVQTLFIAPFSKKIAPLANSGLFRDYFSQISKSLRFVNFNPYFVIAKKKASCEIGVSYFAIGNYFGCE